MTPVAPPNALLHWSFPQICESWLQSYLMQVCKPCHYNLVEAITFQTASHVHGIHIWGVSVPSFLGCGWAYGFILTSLPPQTLSKISEMGLKSYLMQVCKPCHYALVEAVEPFKLHPMSMWYIYERFKHLLRLWMGIWLYTDTITTTDTSPDLGKSAEILPDASVQTMPTNFGWGCRTFQTASQLHIMTYEGL
jgi:hypothetical protein